MRLISFFQDGGERVGIVREDGVVDTIRHTGQVAGSLRQVLIAGDLAQLHALSGHPADYTFDEIELSPVLPDPAVKFLCVGVNYLPHIREMGREPPAHPVVFTRFSNSLVGHGASMVRPRQSEQFDFEGELAVVIGRRARHVRRADALSYVAGYSCFNDGSIRDFQWHGPQWTAGKNFARSGSFGPWLVTADEIPDPSVLTLQTRLNGEVVQSESVAELFFDIPALIEYITSWAQLEPGDVIVTGTPGGVGAGRKPPLWMRPGDTVEVEISGIGILRNDIIDEDAS